MEDMKTKEDVTEQINSEKPAPVATSRAPIKFGIRGRLFTSFGVVTACTFASIVVAWIALGSTVDTLKSITMESSPAVTDALRLSEIVSRIAAAAPLLAAATTIEEEDDTWNKLVENIERFEEIAAAGRIDASTRTMLKSAQQNLGGVLMVLRRQVASRIDQNAQMTARIMHLHMTHKSLIAALLPIIDDMMFELAIGIGEFDITQPDDINLFIDNGITVLASAYDVKSETNSIAGILTTAAAETRPEKFMMLRGRFKNAAGLLAEGLESLDGMDGSDALAIEVNKLIDLGKGEKNIFEMRLDELKTRDAINVQLAAARDLSGAFSDQIAEVVRAAEMRMAASTEASDETVKLYKDVLMAIAAVSLLIAGLISVLYVGRNLVRRLSGLSDVMSRLAEGRLDIEIVADGSDEITAMAKALEVFKENAIDIERMAKEKNIAEQRNEEEKARARHAMADNFENSLKGIVDAVSGAATEMKSTAESMTVTAVETSRQSQAAAAASEQASANVQTVSAAAEEMSASINEIARQVAQSATMAKAAVEEAVRTNETVQGLAEGSQKIGEVVEMISDIANQTNLLALNATIEAARAGDAGKGFAVVASEVKSLATQTAKATEQIAAQISSIQMAVDDAVGAINGIGAKISEMDEVTTAIASAIEEQSAATGEISSNSQQAAMGTQEVSNNIEGVTRTAKETGVSADIALEAAGGLAQQADLLRAEVGKLVEEIRAA